MKNAPEDDMERDRRRPMVRMLAGVHILNPERGRLCGCKACLDAAGLEMVEVLDQSTGNYRRMLVSWFSKTARTADRGTRVDALAAPAPQEFFRSSQERREAQE